MPRATRGTQSRPGEVCAKVDPRALAPPTRLEPPRAGAADEPERLRCVRRHDSPALTTTRCSASRAAASRHWHVRGGRLAPAKSMNRSTRSIPHHSGGRTPRLGRLPRPPQKTVPQNRTSRCCGDATELRFCSPRRAEQIPPAAGRFEDNGGASQISGGHYHNMMRALRAKPTLLKWFGSNEFAIGPARVWRATFLLPHPPRPS